jgi:AbrB family looped-hinge helix DNA binding protein
MSYTLTSKSQVTLPKSIRDHLKVAPGDAVEFRIVADGSVKVEPARPKRRAAGEPSPQAVARLRTLRGTAPTDYTTDELMSMLRGYEDDATDPGFAGGFGTSPKSSRR